ncbi:DUF3450 domain-containing protein [Halomonas piscis]|uniref:DUF3450 domain-containing protein n=2 Tax=Halomonas piscis TaxID=3031727 RepID=A0ABY9Z333_9GAMM|nr:DUF3450 domain-containing protein [Halomonas piscis]
MLLPAGPSLAADDPATSRLAQSGVDAQRTQAALQEQIDQASDQTREALAELRDLESETRTLRQQNRTRAHRLADEAERQRALARALDTLADTREALPRIEQNMARQLSRFIERDMPFLAQERLARVENDEALAPAARIRRLLKAWRTELDYGREVDSWRGRLSQADDDAREVDFLRLGRVGWYYLTPDGREGGVWQAERREWQPLDEAGRREVRHGLLMADDQRAPELLTVPLSVKVSATSSNSEATAEGDDA